MKRREDYRQTRSRADRHTSRPPRTGNFQCADDQRESSERQVKSHERNSLEGNVRERKARGKNGDERNPHPAATASNIGLASKDAAVETLRSEHLYGVMPVLEALRAGQRSIEGIIVAEGAQHFRLRELLGHARRSNIPVRRAPRPELDRITGAANHQGIVAVIAAAHYADAERLLDALAQRVGTDEPPLAVVLDGVEDPRNLGAILRTVNCAGAHGVFIPERRAVGLTETVAKAAAGALEHVKVARTTNLTRLIEQFKERRIWTIGTTANAKMAYTAWDWTEPCALFLGGEGDGLHRLVRERCDALVSIPLHGQIASLNVSVAAAIVLYEAIRQRTAARGSTYKSSIQD